MAVDYLSKWVEAKALPTNDARVVVKFLKSLFSRFGTPRAIISDEGTHFCNKIFDGLLAKYGVRHKWRTKFGAVDLLDEKTGRKFKVNGQQVKQYWGESLARIKITTNLKDP